MYRFLLSFIVSLLILIDSAYSQKVGVVMSGGGAKGLYHIGVLQALEENLIPIDYIAGTSIGAIVGGFYAAGYSPEEIAQIAKSGELKDWVSGRIDNNYGAYFREHNQFRKSDPMLSVRIDTKSPDKTLHLPKGIISSVQIDMALSNYLSPANVASKGDFNNLMIPFFCVASDINSNRERVVFRDGDLGLAVRASMALPVAFKPIQKDGMVLYDGGISDNFPWRPMQELLNPDFMIGVACSSGNVEIEDNISMVDHVFMLTMNRSDYTIPNELGIMIERNVQSGTLDFSQAERIIKQGYDDTILKMDSIKMRVERRVSADEYEQRRHAFKLKSPKMVFDSYEVEGLSPEQLQYVYGYMATNRKNHNILQREMSFEELQNNLYSILSSNDFSTEYPEVEYNEKTERYSFKIKLSNKPLLKLSVGGNISSTPFNQIYLNVDYRHIGSSAKTAYAELYLGPVYTAGIVGGRVDLYRKAPLFFDAYLALSSKNLQHGNFGNITNVNNTLSTKIGDNYLSLGFGAPISKRMMFSLRANFGRETFKYDSQYATQSVLDIYDEINQTNLRFMAVKGEFEHITFDKPLFPTKGSKLTISSIYLRGVEDNYRRESSDESAEISSFQTIPKIKHNWYGARVLYDKYITSPSSKAWFSMGVNVDGVLTNADRFATSTATYLAMPAYQPTLHSKMVYLPEYSARSYIAGGLMPQFQLFTNFYANLGFFTMFRDRFVNENGSVPFPIGENSSLQFISDLSMVYHSRVGALSLSLTKYGISNVDNMYLTFNFGYSMFAPKGTFY